MYVGHFSKQSLCGYGSKFNHQELDRRFSSLAPFTKVSFWGRPIFDNHCHLLSRNIHVGLIFSQPSPRTEKIRGPTPGFCFDPYPRDCLERHLRPSVCCLLSFFQATAGSGRCRRGHGRPEPRSRIVADSYRRPLPWACRGYGNRDVAVVKTGLGSQFGVGIFTTFCLESI